MSWEKRIKLSVELLKETLEVSPEDDKQKVLESIRLLQEYLDQEFEELSDEEKDCYSILLLLSAVKDCFPVLEFLKDSIAPAPPVYMTKKEAEEKLREEYLKSLKFDNDEIASMNINDWISQNNIYIVEENDERLLCSSEK